MTGQFTSKASASKANMRGRPEPGTCVIGLVQAIDSLPGLNRLPGRLVGPQCDRRGHQSESARNCVAGIARCLIKAVKREYKEYGRNAQEYLAHRNVRH